MWSVMTIHSFIKVMMGESLTLVQISAVQIFKTADQIN